MNPATDKQINFLRRLANDRQVGATPDEAIAALEARIPTLSKRDASRMIEAALAAPRRDYAPQDQSGEERPMAAEGFYVREQPRHPEDRPVYEAFKVQWNREKTGTYALRFVVAVEDGTTKARWDYAPGVGRDLAADGLQPMTPGQAAMIGLSHGFCINCCKRLGGQSLSAHVSALIGYGAHCAKANGWPYPQTAAEQRAFIAERAGEQVPA